LENKELWSIEKNEDIYIYIMSFSYFYIYIYVATKSNIIGVIQQVIQNY